MKKHILVIFLILISSFCFAQEMSSDSTSGGLVFNEGAICSKVSRMQINEGKNNYVYQNFLVGAYFAMESTNLPVNAMLKFAGYYPLINWFNGIEMNAKQVLLYGFETFAGAVFNPPTWDFINLKLVPGVHLMYQLSDEYHLFYVGAGANAVLELPISDHFTLLTGGSAFLDYPNLGSNRIPQKFDLAFQYQGEIGMRVSLKTPNKTPWFSKQH